jgi:hypothetical protein
MDKNHSQFYYLDKFNLRRIRSYVPVLLLEDQHKPGTDTDKLSITPLISDAGAQKTGKSISILV